MRDEDVELERLHDGVYYYPRTDGPERMFVREVKLTRFMDVFYLDRPTDELTEEQTFSLCRVRAKHPELYGPGTANHKVKRVISRYIAKYSPAVMLEFGSGEYPIELEPELSTKRYLSDGDQTLVQGRAGNEVEYLTFSSSTDLELADNFLDLVASAFVFHFPIYQHQVLELARCLKPTGVIIANVYLRDGAARDLLERQFEVEGMLVSRNNDILATCKGNEYWLIAFCPEEIKKAEAVLRQVFEELS